jgi:hypothetical protein
MIKKYLLIILIMFLVNCCVISHVVAFTQTFQNAVNNPTVSVSSNVNVGSATFISNPSYPELKYLQLASAGGVGHSPYWGLTEFKINESTVQPANYYAFTNLYMTESNRGCAVPEWYIKLYDSSYNYLTTLTNIEPYLYGNTNVRVELIRNTGNGNINLSINGVDEGNVGYTSVTPTYYTFYSAEGYGYYCSDSSTLNIDDMVQSYTNEGTLNDIVGTIPNTWYLQKDQTGYAVNGLYDNTNQTIHTASFSSSYGRDSESGLGSTILSLSNMNSGTNYETQTIPSGSAAGTVEFNLTDFFASSAPYGYYNVTLTESLPTNTQLLYINGGGYVSWDRTKYTSGDTATINYSIYNNYFSLNTYTYKLVIQNIYGENISSQQITTQTGTKYYTWSTSNTQDVYYAEIIATPISGATEFPLAYDVAELTTLVTVRGYVMNAQTAAIIPNTTITITQGSLVSEVISNANGYYITYGYPVNVPLTLSVNKTDYELFNTTFTPLAAKSIPRNISLMPDIKICPNICLAGLAEETPYNRPIPSALVAVQNTTSGEYYTNYTNIAGYYIVSGLINTEVYNDWGQKTGFANSSTYQVTVVGTT